MSALVDVMAGLAGLNVYRTCNDGPTCFDLSHLVEMTAAEWQGRSWGFGDIIRVDPELVAQPDARRWLILTVATMERPWKTLFVGPNATDLVVISTWKSLTGFVRVEE